MANKIVPAVLLGSAVGDALGMPFERPNADVHSYLKDWEGAYCSGRDHLPPGNWTDDTEMSVALAQSLVKEKRFDAESVAGNYLKWFEGNPTGTGSTTRLAMKNMKRALNFVDGTLRGNGVSFDDPEAVGSGTVMRCAPLGVFFMNKPDQLRRFCREDAYITHAHQEAYAASLAVSSMVLGILRAADMNANEQKEYAIGFVRAQMEPVVGNSITFRALSVYGEMDGDSLSSKEVADSLAGRWGSAWQIAVTAIHCAITHWNDFEAGVMDAVRLGGDCDTRGAVTGAILGARLGARAIPERWLTGLVNSNMGEGWEEKGKCASLLTQLDMELFQAAHS